MFNTTIHKTENHDLEIETRKRYQDEINWLESDLRKSCTPEQLEQAENIVEKFRDRLVFKYISAENSLVNAVVWKDNTLNGTMGISFTLNSENITVKVPDMERVIKAGGNRSNTIDSVKTAICTAIGKKLMPHIIVDVVNTTLSGGGLNNGSV